MRGPWLTLTGLFLAALERRWERRTRREMAAADAGPLPPLMGRWLSHASVTRAAAARVYRRHFDTEIAISRTFVAASLATLTVADRVISSNRARLLAASALAAVPLTKLVAKPLFNEVEASLPVVGALSLLREEEVVWALAAEMADGGALAPWADCAAALPRLPVPSAAQARAAGLATASADPHAFRAREEACRRDRVRGQRRALGWLLGAALAGLLVRRGR